MIPLRKIVRIERLPPELANQQERLISAVEADPDEFSRRLRARPESMEGRYFSADEFLETFEPFANGKVDEKL